jgi:TonB family protein
MNSGLSIRTFVVMLLLALSCLAKDDKQQQAEALFARAAQVQGIEVAGAPPFQLRMSFQVVLAQGPPIDGDFLLIWAAPDKWRTELNYPNFNEVRFGGPGKLSWLRSTPLWPATLMLPDLRSVAAPKMFPDERVKKLGQITRKGARLTCVLLERPEKLQRSACFDNATGAMVIEHKPDATFEYSEFAPFADKSFPRTLTVRTPTRNLAVRLEELTAIPAPDDAMFKPPGDAEEWPACEGMVPVKLLKGGSPPWPKGHYGEPASVLLSLVVEADGKVSKSRVADSGGPDFDAAALAEIKKWRFRPAMCGNTPERQQVTVEVRFGNF